MVRGLRFPGCGFRPATRLGGGRAGEFAGDVGLEPTEAGDAVGVGGDRNDNDDDKDEEADGGRDELFELFHRWEVCPLVFTTDLRSESRETAINATPANSAISANSANSVISATLAASRQVATGRASRRVGIP